MLRSRTNRRLASALVLTTLCASLFVGPVPVTAAAPTPGTWNLSGNMAQVRGFAPLVTFADGTVLTAGGTDGLTYTATAEHWSAGTWHAANPMGQAAAGGVAALLPDGRALFAGGSDAMSYNLYGDIFDPDDGSWTHTTNQMSHGHAYGVAATLASGDVMVIGGYDGGPTLTTSAVDVYSASLGTWSAGPSLPQPRYAFTATTLADGRVLVAGGDDGTLIAGSALSSAVLYTPGGSWTTVAAMHTPRVDAAAALLADGTVLVAGGVDGTGKALNTAEVYDPVHNQWTLTGYMPFGRAGFSMTRLADGRVLAAGGYATSPASTLNTADLYDPTTGGWTATAKLTYARRYHSATLLGDGSVMVAGGHGSSSLYLASSEIYTPPPARVTYPATTYHPLTPARLLDSRSGNGLSGPFYPSVPRQFQVTGRGNVPANAVAVTGILTTTASTALGYLTIGPVFTSAPSSSTLNFPKADNRANNVSIALDATGKLSVVYVGKGTTQAIFDVTGYFTADDTGATFMPLDPSRLLDSRDGTGLSGKFVSNTARTFQVTGRGGVPAEAVAVTGNLTLVRPTGKGWAFIGPSVPADPTTMGSSTVNGPSGDIRANGVTATLGAGGTLSAVWSGPAGSTADLLFDVTGYYVQGTGGARFVPLEPTRLVDTRINLPFLGPIKHNTPACIQVGGRGGVPGNANGVAGNLTVTAQTYQGYLSVAPTLVPGVVPAFSTLNFPKGDNRANGFNVSLHTDGSMCVVYEAVSNAGTQFVLDITGYFEPPPA